MTIQQFGDATRYVQETMLRFHGVFLLEKRTGSVTASLYDLDGFYVEVTRSSLPNNTLLFQSYSIREIDDYFSQVDISSIHHLLG
jgi:hypothetical protein